ncbi:MAG TPA: nitroreductase family deazaflavin-dependent oxidoreductase [Acetobacteraceae bacterium]|nr:nitroreductase family deazaflavin-dependent oxidoreductase [Acetobacteraceae bacterium]
MTEMTAASKPHPWLRRLLRAPAWLYRCRCGWLLGHRFLLLIHTGRRSGLRRCTVLEIAEYRPQMPEAVVVSGWGRGADWLRNLAATPQPEVIIGTHRFPAASRLLGREEAIAVIHGYERRNRWMLPVIHYVLSRLLGWRYDGSAQSRRRLAEQLPLVAFRPAA